jgi:broad specificity phosphatase PhoE
VLVRIVRHACAGSRDEWHGDDAERPLDPVGRAQAEALAEQLGREPAGRLRSSPARRCVETLAPLAARWEVPIERCPVLAVDAAVESVLDLLANQSLDRDLLCTHGEVMAALLERLEEAGTMIRSSGVDLLAKGTCWELTVVDGTIRSLRHLVPATLQPCAAHADGYVRHPR